LRWLKAENLATAGVGAIGAGVGEVNSPASKSNVRKN